MADVMDITINNDRNITGAVMNNRFPSPMFGGADTNE